MLELTTILKDHNLKVTPQRLSIFRMLRNTSAHPSAETIYTTLHDEYPTMSLATVYKTLDALVKHGLVQQLNIGEDSYRYDADTSPHPHIKCMACHKVVDMHHVQSVAQLREEVASLTQFDLSHEQLYFYGICPECKQH
ncbi:Fur family transcriptional regulator [Cellulosilyticum sp. I15G10I2]|uniref:Fur family transcriptional regulator n=1 Tax=Cellulosilyticum sp. I15G10I2 TaxID=1892843 RepID=UPI00085BE0CF|nr:Fur family transcriptional regulator [Cellulosilyticum sp. I15G10I2]